MAKKNEILIGISLDGDSEVKRKLQEVGEAGKRSLDNIDSKLKGTGGKNAALAELQQQATGLRAALSPIAEAGGLAGLLGGAGLGGILARLATGPAGIVAGITATLVGMAKIGDETQRVRGRVAAAGDPKGFERLSERAKTLGTDVASLAPSYENFLALQQKLNAANTSVIHPPGFQPGATQEAAAGVQVFSGGQQVSPPSRETFDKFDNALFTQIRRDTKTNEEARGITDDFKKSLFTGGLTPDLLRGLPPNARNFLTSQLSKPLGQGFENPEALATAIERGRVRPGDLNPTSVINAGAAPNAEFEKAAKDARSFTQKREALQAAFGRLGENAGGDEAGLGNLFEKSAQFIDSRNRPPPPLPGLAELLSTYFNKNAPLPERPGYTASPYGGAPAAQPVAPPPVPPAPQDVSAFTDGRRYSRQLNPTPVADEVTEAGKALAAAITAAADAVRAATPTGDNTQSIPGRAGGGGIDITGGGFIRGPGSTTSDSIPVARVSNKEYVVNAAGTAKAGLAYLDWINAGMPGGHYAEGGLIPGLLSRALPAGNYDVTPTDDGGAIINGVAYPPGSPILQTPEIKQALARARAARDTGSEGRKHKSDFVGPFGGHYFNTPGSYARGGPTGRIARRGYAGGGSIDIAPHIFADGAMADIADVIGGAAPDLSGLKDSSGSSWPDVEHVGSVDLRHPGGDVRVIGPKHILKGMVTAARDQADVSMGSPGWKYGR